MKINYKKEGGALLVNIVGRLDSNTAPELEEFFDENAFGVTSVVIDCSDLEYVSSAGLRVFLSTHRSLDGEFALTKVREVVMEVLDLTGFVDILKLV